MANKKNKKKPAQVIFGPLPVGAIDATIGTELEPGTAVMSSNAQVHASKRHPEDFPLCFPHVAQVIANPLYVGDDLRNHGKIELVSRVPALGTGLLVAVDLTADGDGNYFVASFYPVSEEKINNRRDKGHLKRLIKK